MPLGGCLGRRLAISWLLEFEAWLAGFEGVSIFARPTFLSKIGVFSHVEKMSLPSLGCFIGAETFHICSSLYRRCGPAFLYSIVGLCRKLIILGTRGRLAVDDLHFSTMHCRR